MSGSPRIVESLADVSLAGAGPVVLVVGTFDGVHLAHRELFREAVERARILGGVAAVLTFRNHPREVVSPGNAPPLLTHWPRKRRLIEECGVDLLVGLAFDKALSEMPAESFIRDVVAGVFQAQEVISGPAFHFGHGGRGNAGLLLAMSRDLGYKYRCHEPVMWKGEKVSSTRIRRALAEGDVAAAAELLARPHRNRGRVITGDRLGRTIGFPTANLEIVDGTVVPANGVYAVMATVEGARWPGMMNIGNRPTVGGVDRRFEVHLIGFDDDIVGRDVRVDYCERLRGEERFPGLDALRAQLAKDRDASLAILRRIVDTP